MGLPRGDVLLAVDGDAAGGLALGNGALCWGLLLARALTGDRGWRTLACPVGDTSSLTSMGFRDGFEPCMQDRA